MRNRWAAGLPQSGKIRVKNNWGVGQKNDSCRNARNRSARPINGANQALRRPLREGVFSDPTKAITHREWWSIAFSAI